MKLFLAMFLVLLAGCSTPKVERIDDPAGQINAGERARDVTQAHNYLGVQLNEFQKWLDTAPEHVDDWKSLVEGRFAPIPLAFASETKAIEEVSKSVDQLTKKVIVLEKKVNSLQDPEKAQLRSAGLWWFIVPGLGIIGLFLAAGFIPGVGPLIQKGGQAVLWVGIALVAMGCALFTLAKFMTQIEWVIIGTAGAAFLTLVAAIGWEVWRHRKLINLWSDEELPSAPA